MKTSPRKWRRIDLRVTNWMAEHGPLLLRWSMGGIFLWFGLLKFFPGLSPAENLAARTVEKLSFGTLVPPDSLLFIALLETAIGIGLLSKVFLRGTLFLLLLQLIGTLSPLLFFPEELFIVFPWAPTLEGQYIIKNLILISAALVIGATVRGGTVIPDPKIADLGRKRIEMEKRGVVLRRTYRRAH